MDITSERQFYKQFPSEEACLAFIEQVRWPGGRVCPQCGGSKIYQLRGGKLLKCSGCRVQFTPKQGTVFADSHIPVQDWFYTVFLLTSSDSPVSSVRLADTLEITQKSAWLMLRRLRPVFVGPAATAGRDQPYKISAPFADALISLIAYSKPLG